MSIPRLERRYRRIIRRSGQTCCGFSTVRSSCWTRRRLRKLRVLPPNKQRAPFPRNAGRPWSADDDRALADAFEAGASVGAIAKTFERTRGSITARLVKLGKMAPDPSMRLLGPVTAPAGAEV